MIKATRTIASALSLLSVLSLSLLLVACGPGAADATAGDEPGGDDPSAEPREVVLYSSADDFVLDLVVEAFESRHDIDVKVVGDTEATKTTGLVQRLLAEKDDPKADVWWSSEPFGTVRLAEAGVLAPHRVESAEDRFPGGWPARLRGGEDVGSPTWYGFAQRSRVIAYHTGHVDEAEAPRTLAELTSPVWRDRVGMARPEFGTTRGHMAALLERWGEAGFRRWLEAMRANGLRVYSSNSAIVRAINTSEIDVGLTDTDDVWSGRRNGWPVGLVYESVDTMASPESFGPLLLPNTVGLVAGGPNPGPGAELMAFLLSPEAERVLAESDSRNIPVNPGLRGEFAGLAAPEPALVDFHAVESRVERAMAIVREVLGE